MAALALSIYLFLRRPENAPREIFAIFLFLEALSSLMLFYSTYSFALQTFFLKAYLAIFLFSLFVLTHFVFSLSDRKFPLAYYSLPFVIVVLALFTDIFVMPTDTLTVPFSGSLVPLATTYALLLAVIDGYVLYGVYTKIKSVTLRKKLLWVLLGIGVMLSGLLMSAVFKLAGLLAVPPRAAGTLLASVFIAYPFVGVGKHG